MQPGEPQPPAVDRRDREGVRLRRGDRPGRLDAAEVEAVLRAVAAEHLLALAPPGGRERLDGAHGAAQRQRGLQADLARPLLAVGVDVGRVLSAHEEGRPEAVVQVEAAGVDALGLRPVRGARGPQRGGRARPSRRWRGRSGSRRPRSAPTASRSAAGASTRRGTAPPARRPAAGRAAAAGRVSAKAGATGAAPRSSGATTTSYPREEYVEQATESPSGLTDGWKAPPRTLPTRRIDRSARRSACRFETPSRSERKTTASPSGIHVGSTSFARSWVSCSTAPVAGSTRTRSSQPPGSRRAATIASPARAPARPAPLDPGHGRGEGLEAAAVEADREQLRAVPHLAREDDPPPVGRDVGVVGAHAAREAADVAARHVHEAEVAEDRERPVHLQLRVDERLPVRRPGEAGAAVAQGEAAVLRAVGAREADLREAGQRAGSCRPPTRRRG